MIHDNSSQQEHQLDNGSIRLGAFGLEHADLLNNFYPEDLPEDWRLGFYANEFNALLVPESVWRDESLDLEDWLDVPEAFCFYFECNEGTDKSRLDKFESLLGKHYCGTVNSGRQTIDGRSAVAVIDMQSRSLREWRVWLEEHADMLGAIFLNDDDLSYKKLSDFKSLLELMNL